MERVLITGVTGFVGSYLAHKLLRQGVEVYGLVRHRSDGSNLWRLRRFGIEDEIKIIEGDVTDLSSLFTAIEKAEPDVVFHLAAQSFVARSFINPIETLMVNVFGTQNVLEAIRLSRFDPRVIFAGSSEEYGLQVVSEKQYERLLAKYGVLEPPPKRIPELPIDELNPLRPASPYAVSKVYGDHLCRMYWKAYGVKCIVSRAFNHEGPMRGHHFVTSVVARQVAEIKRGERSEIVIGNVNVFRDWSHVEDIVDGYILLAEKATPGGVYVQGSGRTNSVLTIILLALDEAGYHPRAVETLRSEKRVIDPLDGDDNQLFGLRFWKSKIDKLLLTGELEYTINDAGLIIETNNGKITVQFDSKRFRPSDVPVLMSNPKRIRELGFKVRHSLRDIMRSMLYFYYSVQ